MAMTARCRLDPLCDRVVRFVEASAASRRTAADTGELASPPMARTPADALQTTPLHARHRALGARMTPFGGWDMPLQYSGIAEEHRAVRTAAAARKKRFASLTVRGRPGRYLSRARNR